MNDSPLKVWLERDGALLRLRLARPKANLIDAQMIAALSAAFHSYRSNSKLLAALIDHEGPHFSFGASVEEHLPAQCEQMLRGLHALLEQMLAWPRPILVAIGGQCLGGGLELALAGHLLFAAPEARLGQPEMKLGVFAPAASVLLPLRIGAARAEDLLYSGRAIDAPTALAWGLADAVASVDHEAEEIAAFLRPLGERPPQVARGIKAAAAAWRRNAAHDERRRIETEHLKTTWLHDDHWAAAERALSRSTS